MWSLCPDLQKKQIEETFETADELSEYEDNWNLAPSQTAVVIRDNPKTGARSADILRWGLVPSWADADHQYSTMNAKSEELANKRFYRNAWAQGRRCIIPANAFYEWRKLKPKEKQPYAIARADETLLAFAGLWEGKRLGNGGILRTFTIITCPPNASMEPFHDRRPVILQPTDWKNWLNPQTPTEDAAPLMLPCPDKALKIWPIGKRVGNVRNNDAGLLEALTA